jgi:hypothetical protein
MKIVIIPQSRHAKVDTDLAWHMHLLHRQKKTGLKSCLVRIWLRTIVHFIRDIHYLSSPCICRQFVGSEYGWKLLEQLMLTAFQRCITAASSQLNLPNWGLFNQQATSISPTQDDATGPHVGHSINRCFASYTNVISIYFLSDKYHYC